jgi:hypothetical protein
VSDVVAAEHPVRSPGFPHIGITVADVDMATAFFVGLGSRSTA